MIDWDDLRYFLAVARAGSLSMAARELAVNHTTVSRRVTAMEERHGVRLFERLPEGYTLTQAGAMILEHAEAVEVTHQAVDRLLFAHDYRLSGELVLTMPHDIAYFCALPYLGEFTTEYPDIALKLLLGTTLRNLNAREADIAVRLTASPPEYLIGQEIAALMHGVYQSTNYHANAQGIERVILWNHEIDMPSWVTRHYPNARVALRVDDLLSMHTAVEYGLGIARMPCYVPDAIKSPKVKRRDIVLADSDWGVWLLNHIDLKSTARVAACMRFLKKTLSAQKDLFEGRLSSYL